MPPITHHRLLRRATLVSCLLAGLLSGCESLPSGRVGAPIPPEAARRGFAPDTDAYAAIGYRRDWTGFPEVARSRVGIQFMDVDGDAVIVQDAGSTITVLEARSGQRRWHNTLSNALTKFLGNIRADNLLYSCSEGEVFVLDMATGTIRDRQKLERLASTKPTTFGHLLVYGTGAGQIRAHDPLRALDVWGNTINGAVRYSPVVVGTTIGVVSQEGQVKFLDGASGGTIVSSMMDEGGLSCPPIAFGDAMFVAGRDQSLWAFTPTTARPAWRRLTEFPLTSSPTALGDAVFVQVPGRGLMACERRNGKPMWTAPDVKGQVLGQRAGKLLVWDGSVMTTVEPATGRVFDRVELKGIRHLLLDNPVDGNLYVAATSGAVGKFVPR